ncbi:MAG: hypothetical protein ACTSXP_11885 [Promethearchaeota archaeon]
MNVQNQAILNAIIIICLGSFFLPTTAQPGGINFKDPSGNIRASSEPDLFLPVDMKEIRSDGKTPFQQLVVKCGMETNYIFDVNGSSLQIVRSLVLLRFNIPNIDFQHRLVLSMKAIEVTGSAVIDACVLYNPPHDVFANTSYHEILEENTLVNNITFLNVSEGMILFYQIPDFVDYSNLTFVLSPNPAITEDFSVSFATIDGSSIFGSPPVVVQKFTDDSNRDPGIWYELNQGVNLGIINDSINFGESQVNPNLIEGCLSSEATVIFNINIDDLMTNIDFNNENEIDNMIDNETINHLPDDLNSTDSLPRGTPPATGTGNDIFMPISIIIVFVIFLVCFLFKRENKKETTVKNRLFSKNKKRTGLTSF